MDPDYVGARENLGASLLSTGQAEASLYQHKHALRLNPNSAEAHHGTGLALLNLKQRKAAIEHLNRAVLRSSANPRYLNSYGLALLETGEIAAAKQCFLKALEKQPGFAEARSNLGLCHIELGERSSAEASFRRACGDKPELFDPHVNLGKLLQAHGDIEGAILSFRVAQSIRPDDPAILYSLGCLALESSDTKAAIDYFDRTLRHDPGFLAARVLLECQKRRLCDWTDLNDSRALENWIGMAEREPVPPFAALILEDDPKLQQIAAARYANIHHPLGRVRPDAPARSDSRISIGYFSGNFRTHPTPQLLAPLVERHDKSRFHLHAFALRRSSHDSYVDRIRESVEEFHEVESLSDEEIASRARSIGIDIAIDLDGFTEGGRTGVFARRTAPLQVNFLGYPGSMGVDFYDYIIADHVVITPDNRSFFSEYIAFLPSCYQPNDKWRSIEQRSTRSDWGLPKGRFVFCCFNSPYRITPVEFGIWARLLDKVEGSVLWLLADSPDVETNLKAEAQNAKIATDRLVFTKKLPLREHLERLSHADLFLDCFHPCAHTTASDALRAGVPLVTCPGTSFASRVATSLLKSANLEGLIATDEISYEQIALSLAESRQTAIRYQHAIRAKAATSPLFDPNTYARHFEQALKKMHDDWRDLGKIADFSIHFGARTES